MKNAIQILTLILIFMVIPIFTQTLLAAPPPPPAAVPIDGGLGFLLVAGIAYGAKKLYQNKEI